MTDSTSNPIEPFHKFGEMPMFWGNDPKIMEQIEAAGYPIYYLVANKSTAVKEGTVTKFVHSTSILRIESSFIGRSIQEVNGKDLGLLCTIEPNNYYTLPKMPYAFTQRVESFFRTAHKVHGTEAILILTFDPAYVGTSNPGEGWGCIAPEQSNTAGHCNYQMDSVMQVKPPNVYIVGTWHSHPEMSAFFSPTDDHDQENWDGIHLTTGWKMHSKDGDSEFHIAVIAGGTSYTYQPDQIFDIPPIPDVDTTVVQDWMKNVSKVSYTNYSTTSSGATASTYSNALPKPAVGPSAIKLPPGAPDPRTCTIIAQIDMQVGRKDCPFCARAIGKLAIENRRCMNCQNFIVDFNSGLEDLLNHRASHNKPYAIELDPDKSPNPIVIWNTATDVFTEDLRGVSDPK